MYQKGQTILFSPAAIGFDITELGNIHTVSLDGLYTVLAVEECPAELIYAVEVAEGALVEHGVEPGTTDWGIFAAIEGPQVILADLRLICAVAEDTN